MKSWTSVGRAAGFVLFLVACGASSNAGAAVGRTSGAYAVSSTGAATYTIPIWAPRGPNGLQPSMSLTYNSQAGDGPLGVGWSLSGLSSIYRCAQTYAQDPAPGPITLTSSDVFCMDGQRLRLTGGSYGSAGSTYQTEVANFANVTAYGSAGNGPGYFEVQDRDGRTYEYGNGGNSQVLASGTSTAWTWWLDKVTDRAGNTMTISYSDSNGTAVPTTISWTPSSYGATTYAYTMQLAYGANVPQSSTYGYVAGTPFSNTNLLSSISINYNGGTVKKYALSYQQSPTTGRDELAQVKECADAAQTNCLAPTTLTYQSGSAGVSASSSSVNLGSGVSWYFAGYDLNGDGYKDLIYQVGGTWYVAFGSASGYGAPVNSGISTVSYVPGEGRVLIGDLLGAGKDGLLADNAGTWYYYTWNGSSFSGASTGVPFDTSAIAFALADTNGDGLPDLVSLDLSTGGAAGKVYIWLNDSSGGTASFGGANVAYTNTDNPGYTVTGGSLSTPDTQHAIPVRRIDFDGDGRDDLVLRITWYDSADKIHIPEEFQLLSRGTTFSAQSFAYATNSFYLNWNDDSCTDYVNGSSLFLSTCNGASGSKITLGVVPVGVIDWDGDGREDFLYASGASLYVQPSTGSGLGTPFSTGIAYSSSETYMGGDFTGDGLDELLTWIPNSSSLTYNLHNGSGHPPDLLSSVTDGYGNSVAPTYTSIVQGAYSDYAVSPAYPYSLYRAPLYVVANAVFSDPASPPSGTYSQSYHYIGSWTNLQGRGFSNFIGVQRLDSRNNVWRQDCYENKFPFSGMRACTRFSLDQAGSQLISYDYGNHALITLDGTANNERYFIYQNQQTALAYQVSWTPGSGSSTGPLVETDTATYQYDNYGNVTSLATTKTDNDSGSPYVGDSWTTTVTNTPDVDASTWCLGLLSEQQISYSASDGSPAVTRTRQFTPDTTNCRYTGITTEPSSSTYEVAESLGYDSFGNINSDTITGIGMTARQTTANWGTTGQFPMSVTDPLNETTRFNYNFGYGLVSSETDPNGLTTSWQYGDGFGRVTQETRPDGTYTTWGYSLYSGSDPKPRMHIIEAPHDSSGNVISETAEFLDMLDRLYVEDRTLLDGSLATVVCRSYDSLGRVRSDQVPYEGNQIGAVTYSYDLLNRVTEVQRPINQSDSALQTTSYGYAGHTSTITDPNGHTKTVIRDVNGWLRQSKDAGGYSVILGYDAAGTKTSVTDSLGHTLWTGTYAYGISPFLLSETDVDRGSLSYKLDALGDRVHWTNGKGQTTYASYDALSRLTVRQEPDLYTRWIWGTSASSHNVGKLVNVCTGAAYPCTSSYYYSESDTYDSLSRLSQRAISIPAIGTSTYTWQYNATTGFLDTLTYPVSTSGKALQLKYSYQAGILASITDVLDSPNVTLWKADVEDPDGHITQETLGNGLVTSRAYDAVTQWLSSVQSGPGGGASVQNQGFLYDEVGNVTQRQDNNHGLNENFYYDADNRLSYSTLNGTQNLSLTYDEMGNIKSRSDVAGGATWTYDPVHLHEVTQAGSSAYQYAYDVDGNVTSRQGGSITWSSYDYPTLINDTATNESVSLSYDPDRRAFIEQTTGPSGTEVAYRVGGLLDVVTSGGVTDYRHYIYAGDEPVAIDSRKSSGANAFYYLLSDHQGSISAITNSSGAVVVSESFTAYGSRRNPATWSGSPSNTDLSTIAGITRHGYTFQSALASMGLNDMVGRVQDAITGRFLSADPHITNPTDPQDYNRFSYVVNSPLTYVDPTGFDLGLVNITAPLDNGLTAASGGGGSAAADGTGPSPADQLGLQIESKLNSIIARAVAAPPKSPPPDTQGDQSQQSNPPSLCPPVCPVVQASRLPGPVTTFIFNSFVEPMFGWVDCAGGQCSNGELAWRFVRGPTMVAAGVAGGAVTGTVARAAGAALSNAASNSAPTAAIALLMQLSPDATVGIAQMLNVQGAEQLDQVMLLQTAEEYMSEEGAQELGQFDPMRP